MFQISVHVSNRQDWKQFWSHQHSCYWQQISCLELCLQWADTTAKGSSEHQQLPSAILLQNPGKLQIKMPPLHPCSLNPQSDTAHTSELLVQCITYNYDILYLLFTKTCFVSIPQSPDFLTGWQSCKSHRVQNLLSQPGRRRRGGDRSEETHTQPPRLLGTKFIPISNREFISGERYENQFPSDISVISVLPSSQSGIIPRNNHTPGLE